MKLYGIRYAKSFRYGTRETVFSSQRGNREPIADFSFFYYLAELDGKHILIDTGFRDERLAEEMGVTLLPVDEEIGRVFGSFPEIDTIFLTHGHWDHSYNIDLYPDAALVLSKQTYEQIMAEGSASVRARLSDAKALISFVETQECFYDRFCFAVIGGHTPDSAILTFKINKKTYCITGDECYLCENMEQNIPIGISFCGEKNERFLQKAHAKGWIPLPFHDAGILDKYHRVTENIVRVI